MCRGSDLEYSVSQGDDVYFSSWRCVKKVIRKCVRSDDMYFSCKECVEEVIRSVVFFVKWVCQGSNQERSVSQHDCVFLSSRGCVEEVIWSVVYHKIMMCLSRPEDVWREYSGV